MLTWSMLFTLFWIAYETWQDDEDPRIGTLMMQLLDAAEAAPKPLGTN